MSWSSHSPPLSQTGQSSGGLVSRNSSMYLADWVGVSANDHAVGRDERAGGLQLRGLLNFDQAHAARGLERKAWVVAERGNFRAEPPRCFNDQRALRQLNFSVVHLELDEFLVGHEFLARPFAFLFSFCGLT